MKNKKVVIGVVFAFSTITPLALSIHNISKSNPVEDLTKAREMIVRAEKVQSSIYAFDTYLEAKTYFDNAMTEWKKQNQKFVLLRNYTYSKILAQLSVKKGQQAIQKATQNLNSEKDNMLFLINEIESKMNDFKKTFDHFPMSSEDRQTWHKCQLLFMESKYANNNKNYIAGMERLVQANSLLTIITSKLESRLNSYYADFNSWDKMVHKTIHESRKNKTTAMVIDKFQHTLIVYKHGEKIREFSVELGINWIGDKMQQGDKTTPEGFYTIVSKKTKGQTSFYKALLLDYPNKDDEKRFAQNKKNGIIKSDASIGNLIEIHGNGGKGVDWTDGCIALLNKDMDEVYNYCQVGTKVTIVGSTKSLDKIYG